MTENLGMLNGMQIVESPLLSDKLNPHTFRNERKWAHRKMWKREERFKHIPTGRMTSTVYCANGMLFVSPAQAKLIREGDMHSYSMGARFAESNGLPDYIAPEQDRTSRILDKLISHMGINWDRSPNPIINVKGI